MAFSRVVVLAPHTDDAELGCGGTIARLVEEGAEVFVYVLSAVEESVPDGLPKDTLRRECLRALPKLGVSPENIIISNYPVRRLSYHRQEILEELVQFRRKVQPDAVFLPSGRDVHQDHHVVHLEGVRAFKDTCVFAYELPWNHVEMAGQFFVKLEARHLSQKWDALTTYESQFQLRRSYFTREFIDGLARVRGTQCKEDWAEAFEVLKFKW